jgi:hypothetical protein
MAKLKGLSASIVVDEEELAEIVDEEAQDEEEKRPTVTRYVQVAEGQQFAIDVAVNEVHSLGDADALQYDIFLDGDEKGSILLTKDAEMKDGSIEDTLMGIQVERNGQWFFQRFQFSKLRIGTSFRYTRA